MANQSTDTKETTGRFMPVSTEYLDEYVTALSSDYHDMWIEDYIRKMKRRKREEADQ